MTTQYTPILKLALPVTGELSGTWGDVVNDNITSMVEQAIAGLATISTWTGNSHTLTTANGTTSESRCAMLVAQNGAGLAAAGEIVCPASSKLYVLKNDTSYTITLKTAAGTGVAVVSGNTAFLFCDGTNVNACVTTIVDGRVTGNLTVDGNATVNGNTTLGNATSDTITATARFNTDLLPSTDNARDLGSTANSWKDLYIDGTAYLALVDINGGTIDGVSIGATTPATIVNVDNLSLNGNTISSTDANGNVVIAPNGTGDVQLDADTVRVGDSGAAVTLTSNGAGALTVTTGGAADLTLSTNSGTTSGTIVIANGAGGNITLTPEGTGDVILSADRVQIGDANTDTTLTTNGTGSLNLTTNNGTNSGTIQIAQGANGNITLTPNGTGSVSVPKLVWSNGTATRVPYLTTGGQFTDSANLTFNGTDLTVSGAVNAGSVNATTLDLTNLEVTNIKAKDGTASITLADSTGVASFSANPILSGGTANGVAYLNGSKVLTTGSALTFDGTTFSVVGRLYNGSASTFGASTWGMSLGNGGVSANYFKASTTYWQTDSGTQIAQLNSSALTLTTNLLFSADNTYDIGASGATRPRNLFLAGNATLAGTDSAARYIVNSTSNAGTSDISLGSYSSGAWLNSPSGTTGYLATAGNGILSWSGSTVDVPVGQLSVSGTGSRGVRLRGGGHGAVDIAGDGTTYALGINFYNSTSYSTLLSGIFAYGSGGVYQYMSLGGTAYNNGAIYIDSNKKVGILKLPSAQFDSLNTTSIENAQSASLGFGAAITQGSGTLALAAGSGNQRGNLMTIYGAQGSVTTTIPYGQSYDTLGLTVAMNSASGGGYAVTSVGSYARSDGAAYAFRANAVLTSSTPGTITVGFLSESTTGANLNYGFYQGGASAYNFFNGWVGVGANSLPYGNTTYERMTIEGNTNSRSWLSIRNVNSGSGSYAGVVVNAYGNSWALEMGSTAANSNALNITKDIYGTPQVMAFMATSGVMTFYGDNGNRPVKIGGGYVETKGETGGWEIGYITSDSAGTRKGSFGAAGSNTSLSFMYVAAGGGDSSSSAARFTSNGIGLGTTTPSASGVGITFPATQSASSGANTLDDYEEGTFTPTITGTTSGTVTTGSLYGTYTKIGNMVTVWVTIINPNATTIVGNWKIALPFTISMPDGSEYTGGAVTYTRNIPWNGGATYLSAWSTSGSAFTYLAWNYNNNPTTESYLVSGNLQASTLLSFTMSYRTS